MNLRNYRLGILFAVAFVFGSFSTAYATSQLLSQFNSLYGTSGTALDTCNTCHTTVPSLNPYGTDLQNASNSFTAIENIDSDGDGFTNIQEIRALTFPGDPNSHPTSGTPDTMPPTVTAFTIPATATSLTVPITSFMATDNVGVTGYLITASSTAPAANNPGWTATPSTSYMFSSGGAQTIFAWAKDAAGNVSAGVSASTTITISGGGGGGTDTTPPTITSFTLPATSNSLTVPILSFTASDDVAVTGYMVTQSSRTPSAQSRRWRSSPPASFRFSDRVQGKVTLHAWAKDAAGNVSAPASASTTISTARGGVDDDGSGSDSGEGSGDDSGGVSVGGSGGTSGGESGEDSRNSSSTNSAPTMDMWVSKWFSVTIRTPGDMNSASTGFLKLQSWNSDTGTMQAELFTRSTGAWQSASLDLHVTGTPMRLLLSFDYAAEFQFAASIIARGNAASLQAATLRGVGISLTATSSGSRGSEGTITITGALVPDSAVPSEILH